MAMSNIDLTSLFQAIAARGGSWQAGETSMTALSERERRRLGFIPPPAHRGL